MILNVAVDIHVVGEIHYKKYEFPFNLISCEWFISIKESIVFFFNHIAHTISVNAILTLHSLIIIKKKKNSHNLIR